MSDEQSKKKPPGLVYTFYSYKGGVGRSMALANVGVVMALERHRVLLVDWDLEAPGLEAYFRGSARLVGDPATKPGIVDLLDAHAEGKSLAWRDCLLKAEFFGHSLDIISAGRRSDDYRRRVQQLDWDTLYREHRIGNFVNKLRDEWRDAYDFVLIDSRTGITDTGDVCTVILPDVLVLLFVTNRQNIEGIKSVMARAVRARAKLPVNRSKLLGVPVPARDERDREYQKSIEWQGIFAKEFSELYRDWLPKEVEPSDALNKLFIPYVASWSFGESIPVIESERERADPTSIGAAYTRLATLLSNRLDWRALDARASGDEITGTRVELSKARQEAREAVEQLALLKENRARAVKRSLRVTLSVLLGASIVLFGESVNWARTHGLPIYAVMTRWSHKLGASLPLPKLVEIPAGTFTMGSETNKDEKPVHPVVIAQPFYLAQTETTFEQYDAFAKATARSLPGDSGWGRGTQPVVNVDWNDARAYVNWLGAMTGNSCRLPSEAEWEYAARAGTTTEYALPAAAKGSDDIKGKALANCADCGSKWDQKQTAPVGQFPANGWKVRDMHGNVWEWVEDCYHENYKGAPENGAARQGGTGACQFRVLRGGSWLFDAARARSAARVNADPDGRLNRLGFRVLCVSPIE